MPPPRFFELSTFFIETLVFREERTKFRYFIVKLSTFPPVFLRAMFLTLFILPQVIHFVNTLFKNNFKIFFERIKTPLSISNFKKKFFRKTYLRISPYRMQTLLTPFLYNNFQILSLPQGKPHLRKQTSLRHRRYTSRRQANITEKAA